VHYYCKVDRSFPGMRIRLARASQAEIWSCKKVSSNLCSNFLTSAPRALRLGFQLKWTQIGWRIRIKVTRCMPCVKTCEMEEPVRPAILCCDRPLMNRSLMMAFNNWGLNVISDLKTFLSAEKKTTRTSPLEMEIWTTVAKIVAWGNDVLRRGKKRTRKLQELEIRIGMRAGVRE